MRIPKVGLFLSFTPTTQSEIPSESEFPASFIHLQLNYILVTTTDDEEPYFSTFNPACSQATIPPASSDILE